MKGKQQQQVNRHPGRIEESKEPGAGQKLPQAQQILQRLSTGLLTPGEQRLTERNIKQPLTHQGINAFSQTHQYLGTHPLQPTHGGEQKQHQQGQHCQSSTAATDQHPVVDLQHVQ